MYHPVGPTINCVNRRLSGFPEFWDKMFLNLASKLCNKYIVKVLVDVAQVGIILFVEGLTVAVLL